MQWNAGGWFGGQLGATLWILVAGILAGIRDPGTGVIVVAVFLLPNVLGLILWRRRRLSCYASTQLLIGTCGLCSMLTVYLLESANVWTRIQTGGQVSAQSSYWIIALVFGGLMLTFYLRFGRSGGDT